MGVLVVDGSGGSVEPHFETLKAPPFVEAAHFTPANRTAVDLVVLHSMESGERPGTARAVAEWFHDPLRAPQASAHYCLDDAEVIQCVREQDVAWAAPGANRNGIHIEHAGRAAQTSKEWIDKFSTSMLYLSIELCVQICRAWAIPAELVGVIALRNSSEVPARGITTHAVVSNAFKRSTHTDPGLNFPLAWYCERVAARLAEGRR